VCVNLFVCLGLCAGRAVHLLEGDWDGATVLM
jgi:hypothetical protein